MTFALTVLLSTAACDRGSIAGEAPPRVSASPSVATTSPPTAAPACGDGAGCHAERPRYGFRDVTRRAGIARTRIDTWGALWADALFERTPDGFDRSDAGPGDELVTMSSPWADWDVDGDPDMLILQYLSSSEPTVAYENVDGSYRETVLSNVSGGPWHAWAWGDHDGNGRPDRALVSIEELSILRNTRRGLEPAFRTPLDKGQMAVWLDAENDGDLDLFVVQGAPPPMESVGANLPDLLVLQGSNGFHRVAMPSVRGPIDGCGDYAAAADDDRDGRMDLFVTNGAEGGCRGTDVLLQNRSTGGNWVAIDLDGGPDNPWGFGESIRVRAGDLTYRRQLTDGVNFRSQSEVAHQVLGIGPAESADVRVLWPDGTADCVRIPTGTTSPVTKGVSPYAL